MASRSSADSVMDTGTHTSASAQSTTIPAESTPVSSGVSAEAASSASTGDKNEEGTASATTSPTVSTGSPKAPLHPGAESAIPQGDVDGIKEVTKNEKAGASTTADPSQMDPYVIYALRPPHERAANVIPRMAKAQPDLSPANHRFTRIMSSRPSVKETLPMEYEPRFDSFASSEVASESSFAWSEWTRKSSRRNGRPRRSRGSTPSNGSTMTKDIGSPRRRKKGKALKEMERRRSSGPLLIPEYAAAAAIADEHGRGLQGVAYVQDTDARKKFMRRKSSDGNFAAPKSMKGRQARRSLPRDTYSHPDDLPEPVSFSKLRKTSSHRSNEVRYRYRHNRLRPMPALRKIIPTGTQNVASLKILGLFARPRKGKADSKGDYSGHTHPKRSAALERRKSDSSPHLSLGRSKTRGLPAREGGARRRRRKAQLRALTSAQGDGGENLIREHYGDDDANYSPILKRRREIDLADAGALFGGQGKFFPPKRIGVTREERVKRVSAWQEKLKADDAVGKGSGTRAHRRRPVSLGAVDYDEKLNPDSYEKRQGESFDPEKENFENVVEKKEEGSISKSRRVHGDRPRERRAKSSHLPRRSKPAVLSDYPSGRPRRFDSSDATEHARPETQHRVQSAFAHAVASGRRKLPSLAMLHLRTKPSEQSAGGRPRTENTKHQEQPERQGKNTERRSRRDAGRERQVIMTGREGSRQSKPIWMRLLGK